MGTVLLEYIDLLVLIFYYSQKFPIYYAIAIVTYMLKRIYIYIYIAIIIIGGSL